MKKFRFVAALAIVLIIMGLTGCGSKQDPLVGKWVEDTEQGETLELFSDGTGIVSNSTEQYTITSWIGENNRLKVTMQIPLLGEHTVAYDYEVTKDTLTLIDGDDKTIYKK